MAHYPALIHKDQDSDYGISFVDFPGCISTGVTIEEAIEMGGEALQFHIDGMLEDGEQIPEPSDVAKLELGDADAIVLIEAEVPDDKVERINVTIPRSVLRLIDKAAAGNRSGFLVQAAKEKISRKKPGIEIRDKSGRSVSTKSAAAKKKRA